MPPCPPPRLLYTKIFRYNLRFVLVLAGPDAIIMWSVYLSVFINVPWEDIQLFLTDRDQVDSDLKRHLSFETDETDIDRSLGVCSSKLHLHR